MAENPLSADMAYAYGLHLVRTKKIDQAVEYFKSAMVLDTLNPQLAYTYVLAMDGNNSSQAALSELMRLIPQYQQQQQLVELGMYLSQKLNTSSRFQEFLKQLHNP
jgi:Tfp pilus assembly protein PilF